MNDQYEAFYSIPRMAPDGEQRGSSAETAGPWTWANQVREMVGEGCELSSKVLEEIWTTGLPASQKDFRTRREEDFAGDARGFSSAEPNYFQIFPLDLAGIQLEAASTGNSSRCATDGYSATWLQDPLQMRSTNDPQQAKSKTTETADSGSPIHSLARPGRMTSRDACDLLGVGTRSSEAQIRAAYRRMVHIWHPDRLELSDKKMRKFATGQMAAINEAYHYLCAIDWSLEVV